MGKKPSYTLNVKLQKQENMAIQNSLGQFFMKNELLKISMDHEIEGHRTAYVRNWTSIYIWKKTY